MGESVTQAYRWTCNPKQAYCDWIDNEQQKLAGQTNKKNNTISVALKRHTHIHTLLLVLRERIDMHEAWQAMFTPDLFFNTRNEKSMKIVTRKTINHWILNAIEKSNVNTDVWTYLTLHLGVYVAFSCLFIFFFVKLNLNSDHGMICASIYVHKRADRSLLLN